MTAAVVEVIPDYNCRSLEQRVERICSLNFLPPDSGYYEAASDRGGQRVAMMYSLITTAKMNDIDPQAWLADVLARLPLFSDSVTYAAVLNSKS